LNDGIKFYEEAAQQVERPDLQSLFGNMANHKKQIAQDLSSVVRSLGDAPATSGTFAGSMRKLYAEMRTNMSSDKNHEYVAQLEEFEDRILHTFEKAAADPNNRPDFGDYPGTTNTHSSTSSYAMNKPYVPPPSGGRPVPSRMEID